MKYELSKWQKKFLERFDDPLVIACTAISAGKTRILATWLVLQCLKKPGIRGIIIAQNYKALTKVLIYEIMGFAAQIGVNIDWNKSSQELHFDNGSVLFCYSSENPSSLLGLSEIAILAIDEAAYCCEEIYNYAKDRMRGSSYTPMTRLISSPSTLDKVQNWFSKVVKEHPEDVIHATYRDNPFTSEEFKKELEDRYVIGSNLFRQQCLGEIFDTDVASQIIFRHEFPLQKRENGKEFWFGMDASGVGTDSDMYAIVDKYGMVDYIERIEAKTQEKAGIVSKLYEKYDVKFGNIDMTGGYGQGVYDLSTDKKLMVGGVNFAQKAINFEKYPNARTEIYLELAKAIKEGFWVNDKVKEEMLAQAMFINNKGQGQLVPKDEVKKILGHSPDLCDAVALAVYAMNHGEQMPEYNARKAAEVADKYLAYFNFYNR